MSKCHEVMFTRVVVQLKSQCMNEDVGVGLSCPPVTTRHSCKPFWTSDWHKSIWSQSQTISGLQVSSVHSLNTGTLKKVPHHPISPTTFSQFPEMKVVGYHQTP
ncbi:hypothetical protein BgiMline_007116 [Biomphalaria glabrata]|nr:hypothetical protein BgiMline_022705 [Biomphalaria glabrata]